MPGRLRVVAGEREREARGFGRRLRQADVEEALGDVVEEVLPGRGPGRVVAEPRNVKH